MNDYEKLFATVIEQLARDNHISPSSVRSKLASTGLGPPSGRSGVKGAVRIAATLKQRGQGGKFRAAILVGTTVAGLEFLKMAERAGLLLADASELGKFQRILRRLEEDTAGSNDPAWMRLSSRLRSYLAYAELLRATASDQQRASRLLRASPRKIVKKLLALTHLRFLTYLGLSDSHLNSAWVDGLGSPEEFASIVSLLLAMANKYSPLDSLDFAFPLDPKRDDPDVHFLLEYGQGLQQCYEVSKSISLFGYGVEVTRTNGVGSVFHLRPPFPDFECAVRLGFIRTEMSRPKAYKDATDELADRPISVVGAAEFFADRLNETICEVKSPNTPLSRILIKYPVAPELYEPFISGGLYEDLAEEEELSLDFLTPLRRAGESDIELTKDLKLGVFLKIWRLFRFLCLVDIWGVRLCKNADAATRYNSCIRIAQEDDLIKLVAALGVQPREVQEFLRLVGADMLRLGHLDLQYRPFLRIAPSTVAGHTSPSEVLHIPALVVFSNVLRNVQSANQLRLARNAEIFVEAAADVLRIPFRRVTINRKVKSVNQHTGIIENTDIDVVVLEGRKLYLFECKHSLPPTGPHEMRDLWEDVEKATLQLQKALAVLAAPDRLHSYLTGWFPRLTREDTRSIQISTCVLCSHRIFSGYGHDGIPIRDLSSLSKLIQDGFVGMGMTRGQETVFQRFRLTLRENFSVDDLDEYLSRDPKFFKLIKHFMNPVSRVIKCQGVTVARETYVYEMDPLGWVGYAKSLGLPQLEDERKKWTAPWTGRDLIERLKSRSHTGNGEKGQ